MDRFIFEWSGSVALADALMMPFASLSAEVDTRGVPFSLTFWTTTGKGIQITSVMNEIADLDEIGVLSFKEVLDNSEPRKAFALPQEFLPLLEVYKLMVEDNELLMEAGIALIGSGDAAIEIVPGSFPCSLAVAGIPSLVPSSAPEWPQDKYKRVPFLS